MEKNTYMKKIGEKAKRASFNLSKLNVKKKNSVLKQFVKYLKINEKLILSENKKDILNTRNKTGEDNELVMIFFFNWYDKYSFNFELY